MLENLVIATLIVMWIAPVLFATYKALQDHEFPGKFPVFQLSTSTFPSRSITGCDAWKNIKAVSSSWRWQVFESSKCFADKPFIYDPS